MSAQITGSCFAQLASFTSDTRLYELETPLGKDQLLVESFVAREALSCLYEFSITAVSVTTHIELKSLIAQQVVLRMRLADGAWHERSGYVASMAQLGADGGLARYRLRVVPWLWLATQRRNSRVFQDRSVFAIVGEVIAADAPRDNWRITPEAEAFLSQVRPRSYCCQYRESDYSFITRLLAEEGIGFYFEETDDDDDKVSRQRLVLFSDSALFPDAFSASSASSAYCPGGAVPDPIRTLGSECAMQAPITTIAGWDYKAKRVTTASLPASHRTDGNDAPRAESYDWAGMYPFATQAEAEHYLRITYEAADARYMTWLGEGPVRMLHPGAAFAATGPRDERNERNERVDRFALTSVLHAGVNNLPVGLKKNLQSRLGLIAAYSDSDIIDDSIAETIRPPAWNNLLATAETDGYANRFIAIRADIKWRPVLTDGTGARLNPKPTAWGAQTAIVVGADGSTTQYGTVHTDQLGRIRIRYPWQRDEQNTCWVRVAQMVAGSGHGAQFIPRIGQEVVVKFLANDIDRPIVTGVLYNGQGQDHGEAFAAARDHAPAAQDNKIGMGASPAWHGAAAAQHRHAGFLSGFKSVPLGADGLMKQANQLVFDDTSGRLRTQLATDTAATQLNLGHLVHQADNYRGSFRGSGWELRTDAWGVIRAGKGIFLATYYGMPPSGEPEPAGENSGAIALLQQAKGFADRFNQAAIAHGTVQLVAAQGGGLNGARRLSRNDAAAAPIAAMLRAMSGQVSGLDGSRDGGGEKIPHFEAPLVSIAGQAGLGITASDGLHMAAGEVAHFASGRDTHIAAGEALSMQSGQALGILAGIARAGEGNSGIKLYAGQGDVDLQAQTGTMTFAAEELIQLASANGHIDFAAAKSITLRTARGACLTIKDGDITFSCPGTISIKAASKSFTGPQ